MNQELEQLKNDVAELKAWKDAHVRQQISFPVDYQSRQVIARDVLVATGNTFPITITDLLSFGLEVIVDGVKRGVYASNPLLVVTAIAATDVLTTPTAHGFINGDTIAFATTNTLPAPIDSITIYYVISATTTTFKVSLTSGGSAVDITDTGTGTHYVGKTS